MLDTILFRNRRLAGGKQEQVVKSPRIILEARTWSRHSERNARDTRQAVRIVEFPGPGLPDGPDVISYQCITNPPSTFTVCPVTLCARRDARNTAMPAMSSGCCQRPSGTTRRTFSPAHSS